MNWISTKDKLPKHNQAVLGFSGISKNMHVLFFIDKDEMNKVLREHDLSENTSNMPYGFCSIEVKGNVSENITHWMPLPNLPTNEE